MDEELIIPAQEEVPRKSSGINKLLFIILAILIIAIGVGAFLLGSKKYLTSSPSPTSAVSGTQTEMK